MVARRAFAKSRTAVEVSDTAQLSSERSENANEQTGLTNWDAANVARPCPARPQDSGLQVIRDVRQDLAAVLRDEQEVLEADAAVALAVRAGLDCDDVAGHERLVAGAAEGRIF